MLPNEVLSFGTQFGAKFWFPIGCSILVPNWVLISSHLEKLFRKIICSFEKSFEKSFGNSKDYLKSDSKSHGNIFHLVCELKESENYHSTSF